METQTLRCTAAAHHGRIIIAHELAQWFGDSVSPRTGDLCQGLATYAEHLWEARGSGADGVSRSLADMSRGYLPRVPVGQPPPDELYSAETYLGGALVFHALRLEVGDETFFDILRTFHERYRDSYAGTDEFIAAEEVSGQTCKCIRCVAV